MKKIQITLTAVILILIFFGATTNGYSEEWIEKVIAEKKFDIKPDAKLIIDHEYGTVRCKNWNQNVISIKVTVRVKTTNQEKALKIINKIDVNIDGSTNKVEASCDLNQKLHGNSNKQVVIDFDIFMPNTVNLLFNQKFGGAFIEEVSGTTDISCEYGNLEIISLNNIQNKLELNFTEATIEYISNCNVELSYSQFDLKKTNNISLESEYSDLKIDDASLLSLEIEGGNANIGHVDKLELESNFSNIEVQNINKSINADTEYGSLNIYNLNKLFTSLLIQNKFGSVGINTDKESSFSVNIANEFGTVSYPDNLWNISSKKIDNTTTILKGEYGKENTTNSIIEIHSEYGAVNITSK